QYLRSCNFMLISYDCVMHDYVFVKHDRLVELPQDIDMDVAAFTELVTIAVHSLIRFENKAHTPKETVGVWGDGNLGFISSLILKKIYPESKVIIFSKTDYKLNNI